MIMMIKKRATNNGQQQQQQQKIQYKQKEGIISIEEEKKPAHIQHIHISTNINY